MKYGIFDHVDRGTAPLAEFYEDRLKLAEKYDQAGFRSYHTAEHHETTLGMASSPSVFLSALAQRTKNLRFGPLVYCLPQYHPVRLYEEICMLDNMSQGRFELGVGKGISSIESSYFGLDPEEVPSMYREYYQFLMQAFSEPDEVTFKGKHFSVENMPLEMRPVQNPHPPILLGGSAKRLFDRVAAMADGWAPWEIVPDKLAAGRRLLNDACERIGRAADTASITVFTNNRDPGVINAYSAAGADRVVITMGSMPRHNPFARLEQIAKLVAS